MAQKLWEKSVQVNKEIDRFTVGRDREMDLYLAKHDVMGSMAHITMLQSIGLLTEEELSLLLAELKNIYAEAERGEFVIEDGERIAQMVIARHEQAEWEEVEVLDETERGAGGFGHTGTV